MTFDPFVSSSHSFTAYTRYVLETTTRGDLLSARVATAPCLIGYGEVGARLTATQGNRINNPYQDWINEYGGERYQTSAANGIKLLEETVAKNPISEERLEELAKARILFTCSQIDYLVADLIFTRKDFLDGD